MIIWGDTRSLAYSSDGNGHGKCNGNQDPTRISVCRATKGNGKEKGNHLLSLFLETLNA